MYFIKWTGCNKGQAFTKALLFVTARGKTSKLAQFFPAGSVLHKDVLLDNVWHLFYWLPARGKTWWKLTVFCQKRGIADGNPCYVVLFHCQHPSAQLAARMVMLMENKHPLQRPLKMNEGNEQITQPFYACRLQDHHFCCKRPLHNNNISKPTLL